MKQEALAAGAEEARARKRRPGGGRKRKRPDYDAGRNLEELMDAAVELYDAGQSLQAIADELALNPIKVRKLLITAEVYESEIAVNWALQKSFLTTALFGTQHRARAIENCHALDWTLSDAETAKLDQALVAFEI